MKVNKKWSIEPSSESWNVTEKTYRYNPKTKKHVNGKKKTYHGTFMQACRFILDNCSKQEDINSLLLTVHAVERCNKNLIDAVEKSNGAIK